MSAEELSAVKTQMDLLDWNEVIVQAFYAEDDAQVKQIIESFRDQLKSAGVEQFEEYVGNIYAEDNEAVNFYN